MPLPDDVAIRRFPGVISDAPESDTVRHIKLLLSFVLTLGGLMTGPAGRAQARPLFIDSPAASEVGADGTDAPEIAPIESALPAPVRGLFAPVGVTGMGMVSMRVPDGLYSSR